MSENMFSIPIINIGSHIKKFGAIKTFLELAFLGTSK